MTTNGHARTDYAHRVQQLLERYSRDDRWWSCSDLWYETNREYYDARPTQAGDRDKGQDWPVFSDETDLARLRSVSRKVTGPNSYGRGLLENFTNLVIGKGFKYKVVSKEGKKGSDKAKAGQDTAALDQLVARTQDVVDRFLRRNNWNGTVDPLGSLVITGSREREIFRRVMRDGECFVRFYTFDGELEARVVEPDLIRDPHGATWEDGWSLGVRHKVWKDDDGNVVPDYETAEAYYVVHANPSTVHRLASKDYRGEEVDAADMMHVKGPNTDSTVKRGIPFFYGEVAAALERARVLERNTSIGAAARAAIAEHWEHEHGTQSEVNTFAAGLAEDRPTRTKLDGSTETENLERRTPGMIRRTPSGIKPVFPAPDNTPAYLEGVQASLRAACAAGCAPEYWTADSSNGTYAGLKESGSPVVKHGESQQVYYQAVNARVVWKAIQVAVESGRLGREALTLLDLQVEGPAVLQRDRLQVAQEGQIYNALGAVSPQTLCMESGRDYEIEAANLEAHTERFGQAGSPLGMPGDTGPPGMAGLGDDAGGALHEGKGGAASPRPFPESLLEGPGTCKPGERSDLTGCAPATADAATDKGAGASPKAPHEMSRDEYARQSHQMARDLSAEPWKHNRDFDQVAKDLRAAGGTDKDVKDFVDLHASGHERIVSQALAAGKKVPDSVLADYPHLKPETASPSAALTVMTGREQAARDALKKYVGSPEYKTDQLMGKTKGKEAGLRKDLHDAVAERLAPAIDAVKDKRHADRIAANKHLQSLSPGEYVTGAGGRVGAVVEVPITDRGNAFKADKRIGKENGVRWLDTNQTMVAWNTKDGVLTSIHGLGVNAKSVKAKESVEEAVECDKPGCEDEACPKPLLEGGTLLDVPDERQDTNWSCILPGQELQGRVIGASKAWYAGEAVKIRTAGGAVLSVTSNHPVLTVMGFVAAGKLEKGQRLLHHVGEDESAALGDDEQHAPAVVEEVFRSLLNVSGAILPAKKVRAHPFDFHGDAKRFEGEVEVVGSYGELRRQPTHFGGASQLDIALSKEVAYAVHPDAVLALELLQGTSGAVVADEIVDVDRFHYEGPVYDFESPLGWIVVNDLCISNCGSAVCSAVARYFGVEPDAEAEAVLALGSSPRDGTDPEKLVSVLEGAGLSTTALSGMDLETLEYFVKAGRPVVCCIQAWEEATVAEGAGTCKPGERADLTGCAPATKDGSKERPTDGGGGGTRFGESRAKVVGPEDDWARQKTTEQWGKFFGKETPMDKAASLVGAPDDATVRVTLDNSTGKPRLEMNVTSPTHTAVRYLGRDDDGKLYLRNEKIVVNDAARSQGLGSEIFGRQVENASAMGVSYITCHAAKKNSLNKKNPYNGYYTWPRLGYDQPIDDKFGKEYPKVYAAVREKYPEAKSVHDVMSTPEGRDWWKANGTDLHRAKFDLSPASRSLAVLGSYLEERSKRKAG